MKEFLVACAVAIVVALGSVVVLNGVQKTADQGFTSTNSVRL